MRWYFSVGMNALIVIRVKMTLNCIHAGVSRVLSGLPVLVNRLSVPFTTILFHQSSSIRLCL